MKIERILKRNVPLAQFTTIGVGGESLFFSQPESIEELIYLLDWVKKEELPLFIMGGGSNTIFKDEGFKGAVIKPEINGDISIDGDVVSVSAFHPLPGFVRKTGEAGLSGLEELSGIPGRVGGAIFMNAGSFGKEVKDNLVSIDILTYKGEILHLPAGDLDMGYRESNVAQLGIVIKAQFRLQRDAKETCLSKITSYKERRLKTQPIDRKTAGCIFKNPPGELRAGELLDRVGLKGKRIGGACYSKKHANFIINISNASFRDIEELIEMGKAKVKEVYGIILEQEVILVEERDYRFV